MVHTKHSVSIPKRVSEALNRTKILMGDGTEKVSIPKRVSEALNHRSRIVFGCESTFQSLKGFQRL